MCADYAKEIGFEAQFLIEPKPKEPTLHQYDFDAATAIEFLRNHDLTDVFKLNLEGNHANLAGHTYQHEIRVARESGFLGSLDANQATSSSAGIWTSSRPICTRPSPSCGKSCRPAPSDLTVV